MLEGVVVDSSIDELLNLRCSGGIRVCAGKVFGVVFHCYGEECLECFPCLVTVGFFTSLRAVFAEEPGGGESMSYLYLSSWLSEMVSPSCFATSSSSFSCLKSVLMGVGGAHCVFMRFSFAVRSEMSTAP